MGLTRLAIRRPIILLMVLAAIMVLGWRAQREMPAELDPRVDIPILNIMTVYPGAGPEEVEQRLSRPIEDSVATVNNVTTVESRSLEGVSFVVARMKLGADVNTAAADVRARLDTLRRDLPEEVQPSEVSRIDYNARPVMVLGVTGDRPLQELRRLVDDQIRPRLSQVPGLGNVTVVGGLQREVQIQVDPERLEAYGVSLLDLLRPLRTASQSAPAGSIRQGERDVSVRVIGEFRSLEELRNTPIPPGESASPATAQDPRAQGARPQPSATLRLRDLATVTDTVADRDQITRVGGRESIGLVLSRISDANTVHVADGVKDRLKELAEDLPRDVKITTLQDNSQAVADSLEDINFTLILGSVLAVLVVWLFLHSFRNMLIVAMSIPTTIVGTFIVMYFAGFSLNQMTMLALSLSVGILVDDTILVLECIHRHRAMGKDPEQAALDGRAEIGLADAANTFVDVVVFVPIAFMGGIVGQFFRQFGLTIATATLASLYISFSLTPMLAARWFRKGEIVDRPRRGIFAVFESAYSRLERGYRRALGWALRNRLAVVVLGFGSLAAVGYLSFQVLGFDFTPLVDRGQVEVRLELAPGASLKSTDELMAKVEAEAAKIHEVDSRRMLASVGEIIGGFGSVPDRGPQFGQLTLMLIEKQGFLDKLLHPFGQRGRRDRTDEQVARELRDRLDNVPGLAGSGQISVTAVRGLTAALAPIQLSLQGNDLRQLEHVSGEVMSRLKRIPELQSISSSVQQGKPELQVRLNRDAADDLYVSSAELTGVIRTAIAGNTDLRYREKEDSIPVRLLLTRQGAGSPERGPEAINGLLLARRGPTPVFVGDVADIRLGTGPTKIERSQRVRSVVISAQVREGTSLGAAQSSVDAALADLSTGSIKRRWEGDVNDMNDSAMLMAGALILAIVLAYMLMAAVFNNLLHPLTIMCSVPMALVGGLLGLIVTGTTMNIVSMIGIVMLVGLVSKNAILLVDYTNTLREQGMARRQALLAAGPVRLRPILMTTVSTVFAMTPVALQIGRASEMRSPMAIVVIGGLILSTLLTLLVIPVMYTYFDDFSAGVLRGWGKLWKPVSPELVAPSAAEHGIPVPPTGRGGA